MQLLKRLRVLPGRIHDSVCQIKEISSHGLPPSPRGDSTPSVLHKGSGVLANFITQCMLLVSAAPVTNDSLSLRAVVCCCWVMSWPLALVSGAFSCQLSGTTLQLHTHLSTHRRRCTFHIALIFAHKLKSLLAPLSANSFQCLPFPVWLELWRAFSFGLHQT